MTVQTRMMNRMIEKSMGNAHDVEHFLKGYAYASPIGKSKGPDDITPKETI